MDKDRIDPARTKATIQRSLDKAKDRRIDMTDILERLRTKGGMDINHCPQCGADDTDRIDGLMREAADEIRRLRVLANVLHKSNRELEDESKQLRDDIAYWSDKMTEAHAEIRRLRVEAGYD